MAFVVCQRVPAFGIRLALGASRRDILMLAVRPGMLLTLAGAAVGEIVSIGVTRLMSTLLFGVSAVDPLTFTAATVLLASVALLACLVPARSATRVSLVK